MRQSITRSEPVQSVPVPPAARRALVEAAHRRACVGSRVKPREYGGPAGLDPVRYNDWERKGIAVDF